MPMKSPFPGMDPWLEQHWGDIHHRLVTYACDHLQPQLPGGLRARMQERVLVEKPEGLSRGVYPDVRVVERGNGDRTGTVGGGAVATAEPLIIHSQDEPEPQGFIEIIDVGTGRVITVIEVLSPSNKVPGPGQNLYLKKQQEMAAGRVSLVEIDLLRAGERILNVRPFQIPQSHRTTYQICVRRGWKPLESEIYAVPLRQPLPTIRIPLRESDADVTLALQPLIEQAYQNGGYDDLNYSVRPDPPSDAEDAAWADKLLKGSRR